MTEWSFETQMEAFQAISDGWAKWMSANKEGYSEVVLKAWDVKVVVAVCSGGSSSSKGLLRRRPSASPGCGARGC